MFFRIKIYRTFLYALSCINSEPNEKGKIPSHFPLVISTLIIDLFVLFVK